MAVHLRKRGWPFRPAASYSDNTIRIYTDAAQRLAGWLQRQPEGGELPPAASWDEVASSHVRGWIIALLDSRSDGYANNQYRSVQQFFKWYAAEEDLPNPMAGMSPPHVPEQPVPVLRNEQLGALLKSCAWVPQMNDRLVGVWGC